MRFKLDENLPASFAVELAALGHDVDTAVDEGLGADDDDDVWAATPAAFSSLRTSTFLTSACSLQEPWARSSPFA